jgi:hypothetical protein
MVLGIIKISGINTYVVEKMRHTYAVEKMRHGSTVQKIGRYAD